MEKLSHRFKSCIILTLSTMAFLTLLAHKSGFPVFFHRYSVDYTIILGLAALNLTFLSAIVIRRVSFQLLANRFSRRMIVCLLISFACGLFLLDFSMRLAWNPSHLVIILLLGGIVIQTQVLLAKQDVFGHLTLGLISLVISLILLELVFVFLLLHSKNPRTHSEFLQLVSFRWPHPISEMKPAGTFRILGVSDSFGTVGGKENYHYMLEGILRRNASPRIEMVNISLPAYEPLHQLDILRFGMTYTPDLVLHGFFVGNDFSFPEDDIYTYRGAWTKRRANVSPYMPHNFLSRSWIVDAVERVRENWQRKREQKDGVTKSLGTYSMERFLQIQYGRMIGWGRHTKKDAERRSRIFPVLDAIRSKVERSGSRYVIVIHPDQTQVDERLREEIVERFDVDEAEFDYKLPQKLLRSYCTENGIPCLDLLPSFRAKGRNGDLYLLRDTHYNEAGNRLAAIAIVEFLKAKGLVRNIPAAHQEVGNKDSETTFLSHTQVSIPRSGL